MNEFSIFLVSPVGYEHLATVVIADSKEEAVDKMLGHPSMEGLEFEGVVAINLNEHFLQSGYEITISKVNGKGMYH